MKKQTIPHGDTHETTEGTALYAAIGAANYWHKKAQTSFRNGFRFGFLLAAVLATAWVAFGPLPH
jgi:hypothetical protein